MKMKKVISILLALILCLSTIPFSAVFAEETADTAAETAEEETAEEAAETAEGEEAAESGETAADEEVTESEEAAEGETEESEETEPAEEENVVSDTAKGALEYLNILGICEYEESALTENITRGEFAALAAIAGGYTGGDPAANVFYDVTLDNPNASYINALAQAGITAGFSSGQFFPDDNITVGEAVTVLVRILGYGFRAESIGGYPNGYIITAERLGILKGVSDQSRTNLTKEMAVLLIFNALDVDVMEQTSFGSDATYEVREGKTLAYNTFRIVHIEGTVDAVDLTALKGENHLKPFYTEIGGVTIYIEEGSVWDYLGYDVDAYCQYNDKDDTYVLRWITKTGRNNETVIDIDDIENIGSGYVEYSDEDGNTKRVNYNKVAPIIYNGAATSEYFDMDMITENGALMSGTVSILDNDYDREGDVVFVNAFTDIVVSAVDTTNYTVYDAYNSGKRVVINTTIDDPYTIIYSLDGMELSLGDVQTDNVLSVYKSKDDADQKYWRIYRSNQRVEGTITSIGGPQRREIEVNDVVYELTDTCLANVEGKIKAGMSVTLLLNRMGKVAGMNFGSDMAMAYIIALDSGDQDSLSGNIQLKLLTEDSNINIYPVADKVKIDDAVYESSSSESGTVTVESVLKDASTALFPNLTDEQRAGYYGQPIRYKLNSENQITFIDTVLKGLNEGTPGMATSADVLGDNALYTGTRGKYRYRSSGYLFGGKFLVNTYTKFFTVPDPAGEDGWKDDSQYTVMDTSGFASGNSYDTMPLFFRNDAIVANYAIYFGEASASVTYQQKLCVVSAVYDGLVDGKEGTIIEVVGSGGKTEIMCESGTTVSGPTKANPDDPDFTVEQLKIGDVIRYMTGRDGLVFKNNGIELYYRIQDDEVVKPGDTNFNSSFIIYTGYAKDKAQDGIRMYLSDDLTGIETSTDENCVYVPNWSNCSYILYDDNHPNENEWVRSGSWGSIMSYEDVGEEATKIMVQADVGTPSVIIVIRKGAGN